MKTEVYFDNQLHIKKEQTKISLKPFELRLNCPCAHCVDELSGRRKLKAADILTEIQIIDCVYVGNYGLKITFSDNHSSGIYPFDLLESLAKKA